MRESREGWGERYSPEARTGIRKNLLVFPDSLQLHEIILFFCKLFFHGLSFLFMFHILAGQNTCY